MLQETSIIKIFYSYSHSDEILRKKLDDHLAFLKRESVITWFDREINLGDTVDETIKNELNEADIILLLISSSFLSSFYCYDIEMKRAMEKHEAKESVVVPVLLSDCVWQKAPFAKLLMAPYDAKPINNSKHWATIDEAFTNVSLELEKTVNRFRENRTLDKKSNIKNTSPEILKNNLQGAPKSRAYFTGREIELIDFKKAIDAGNTFIAIDGPGGIGKTQFVSRCIERYIQPEKIIWYECTPASQFDTLISEAGYPELLEGSTKTDREKFSAFKDKIQENNYFLFLDNFQETNSNYIFRDFLKFIQEYLRGGCVVVIDRDDIRSPVLMPKRIRIEGFKEDKLDYAKSLIIHAYENDVYVTDDELNKLCEQLQGYPLAIDFAIYLLSQGETTSDILSKIVREGDYEQIGERLLNAIFSRQDATQEEKDFMRQFSVFSGAVSEQTVKVIISDSLLTFASRRLLKKNLLTYSNSCYEVHPLVREFCYKELIDKEIVHNKVAEFYIQQRSTQLSPALEEQIFFHLAKSNQWEKIESEIETNGRQYILLGQIGLVKELLDKLKVIGIEKPIFNIFYGDIAEIQGEWNNAEKYYATARAQEEDIRVKVEGTNKYGEIIQGKGNTKEAFELYREAYEFSKELVFLKKETSRALNNIGTVYELYGELDEAINKFSEALDISTAIDYKVGIANSLKNIGSIYQTRGKLDEALIQYEESLNIEKEIKNRYGVADSLLAIAGVLVLKNNLTEALKKHKESLEINQLIGSKSGIATSINNIASLLTYRDKYDESLKMYEDSLKINEEIGNKSGIAVSLGNIGFVLRVQGKFADSLVKQQESIKMHKEIGDKNSLAISFISLGSLFHAQKQFDEALLNYERGLKISEEIGDLSTVDVAYHNIGSIYIEEGKENYELALTYLFKSLALNNKIGVKKNTKPTINLIVSIRDNDFDLKLFRIFAQNAFENLSPEMRKYIPLQELLKEPIHRTYPKVGNNQLCPCGSGNKYKFCHKEK